MLARCWPSSRSESDPESCTKGECSFHVRFARPEELRVQGLLNPEKKKPTGEEKEKEPLDPNVREARDLLQRALGLKVSIEDKNGRGRVIIEYARLEDFDALLETIAGS